MTLETAIFIGAVLTATAMGATVPADRDNLVVHEWGTFTSVAGATGEPVQWAPLAETADLPCFVDRLSPQNPKSSNALVRMETPVLYFYPQHEMTLSVHVSFPHGWITEWYPRATRVLPKPSTMPIFGEYNDGQIAWDEVHAIPHGGQRTDPQYPVGQGASRYYAARHTDSAPLKVGEQEEKMIFYRGIGNFAIPLHASFDGEGMLRVRNAGGEPVPMVMLFENRDGRTGYRILDFAGSSRIKPAELTGSLEDVKEALKAALVKYGLFAKEASAMIETWQDSWFEEGSRLIYIVPRGMVDRVLPLSVSPAPSRVDRVFVGRIEMLSPAVRMAMETDLAVGKSDGLQQFGRFLEPFVEQIRQKNPGLVASAAAVQTLNEARTKLWQGLTVKCIP